MAWGANNRRAMMGAGVDALLRWCVLGVRVVHLCCVRGVNLCRGVHFGRTASASVLAAVDLGVCRHRFALGEAGFDPYPEYDPRNIADRTRGMAFLVPHLMRVDVCGSPNPLHVIKKPLPGAILTANLGAVRRLAGSRHAWGRISVTSRTIATLPAAPKNSLKNRE